jgi:hypothetical protein
MSAASTIATVIGGSPSLCRRLMNSAYCSMMPAPNKVEGRIAGMLTTSARTTARPIALANPTASASLASALRALPLVGPRTDG